MDESDKRAAIEHARRTDTCPQCRRPLAEDRVGSGSLTDGVFCSLDCQAQFHDDYFRERIRQGLPSPN
jgi:hypothetical protein